MEDHLKNKDRLEQEWIALCAYEAEPCATTIALRVSWWVGGWVTAGRGGWGWRMVREMGKRMWVGEGERGGGGRVDGERLYA